jgi:hypothetical protein
VSTQRQQQPERRDEGEPRKTLKRQKTKKGKEQEKRRNWS